jgi:hypothetical protein
MIDNKLENCATYATPLTLLERMRNKRQEASVMRESSAIPLPVVIDAKPGKLLLPSLVIEWLSICLNEGHIQPSQSSLGTLEGWPIRPYFKNSLYVDFECWCLKANVPAYLISSRELFYQVANLIFESIPNDKYQFPVLATCRENFSKVLKENQYDQS